MTARYLIVIRRMEDEMSNEKSLSRREFTLEAALAILAGVTITIGGCGSEVQIAGNQRVSKESTNNDGHTHTVTFN